MVIQTGVLLHFSYIALQIKEGLGLVREIVLTVYSLVVLSVISTALYKSSYSSIGPVVLFLLFHYVKISIPLRLAEDDESGKLVDSNKDAFSQFIAVTENYEALRKKIIKGEELNNFLFLEAKVALTGHNQLVREEAIISQEVNESSFIDYFHHQSLKYDECNATS